MKYQTPLLKTAFYYKLTNFLQILKFILSVPAEKSTPVKLIIAPIKKTENDISSGIIIAEDTTLMINDQITF